MAHTQKSIKTTFLAVLFIKLFALIINSVRKLFFTVVYRFIEAILNEYDYCKKMIKNHVCRRRKTSIK